MKREQARRKCHDCCLTFFDGLLEILLACEASLQVVGTTYLVVVDGLADIVSKEVEPEVEELVERGCFLRVCRLLAVLELEVAIEEQDGTEKLNDHEVFIEFHNSEQ